MTTKWIDVLLRAGLMVTLVFSTGACEQSVIPDDSSDDSGSDSKILDNQADHEADGDYVWDVNTEILITLNESSISCASDLVTISESTATITGAGNYVLTGSLSNGQIVVNVDGGETIRLILKEADIHCESGAPIFIQDGKKVIIWLAEGTENDLSDGSNYVFEGDEDEPNATLFSKSDLSIAGTGMLTIDASYADAIASKDGLVIASGKIGITAADDGIRGKDYTVIRGGIFTIEAAGDGITSTNEDDPVRGYVSVENGTFTIVAGGDGIQAVTDVMITAGEFDITAGGGSSARLTADLSAKGLKAGSVLKVTGGQFTINCADDAVHSNDLAEIYPQSMILSSGDDGIHADSTLYVNGGDIQILKSYEGLESSSLHLTGGSVHLVSSDDGINAAGGNDGSGFGGGPGDWGGGFSAAGDHLLEISGGYYYVNAGGDGVDVNGSIEQSGGTIIVDGPTENMNGALDCDGDFAVSGGYLLAVGSSGMAEAPKTTSTQYAVLVNFTSAQAAGSLVHLQDTEGNNVFTFQPAKRYQSVAFCSPILEKGETYALYLGGSCTGDKTDGLYSGEQYTPGNEFTSFKISSIVTKINSR